MILRVLHNQCYPTRLKHSSIFTNTLQANKPAREKRSWYLHVVASGWERQHQGRLWQGDIGWGKKWRIATRWMQDASPRHWPSLPRGRKSAHTGGWPSSLFVIVMHVCCGPLIVRSSSWDPRPSLSPPTNSGPFDGSSTAGWRPRPDWRRGRCRWSPPAPAAVRDGCRNGRRHLDWGAGGTCLICSAELRPI